MEKHRVVVVDDSPFSISVISDILVENGFEVVGTADSLESVREVVKDKKPSLVTMDMTLPGTDGLECTRAIHEIDKDIKVIVVSSMMDDEIVIDAKKNKVSAYVQKPIDADELITAIERIMSAEELCKFLQNEYFTVFKESLKDGLNRMTKALLTYEEEYTCDKEYELNGIAIIVGIIGEFSGDMMISLSKEAAEILAVSILKRELKSKDEVTAILSEFANIVSGNACSVLNRKNRALGLRVAPPTILGGKDMLITPPRFVTQTAIGSSVFGKILINVGFEKE